MRTRQERIVSLHMRMKALREQQEKRKTAALGLSCAGLAACLLALVFGGTTAPAGMAGQYSGATMAFENAGPYVLTAVGAFMIGVIITVICIRKKRP